VKASKGTVGRSVDQPDAKIRFYLFYGPDEAQARALAERLAQALGATRVSVAAAALKDEPGALLHEANAMDMFGGPRAIVVEGAGDSMVDAADMLLSAPPAESVVIAIGGGLTKSSKLVKLAEGHGDALSYAAYLPEGSDAARMVSDVGRRVGLKMGPEIAGRIAGMCGNDQAIVTQELSKFALYLDASPHTPKELTDEPIEAVGVDSSESAFLRLADMALAGDLRRLANELQQLGGGSSEAIPIVRSMQRRLMMLAPIRARVERGERPDAVMTSLGKALFWKDKDVVGRMLAKWSAEDLAVIGERIGKVERGLMLSPAPEREALGEELLAIARKARSL